MEKRMINNSDEDLESRIIKILIEDTNTSMELNVHIRK